MTEWRLRGGIDYDFETDVHLLANETLLVVPFNPANANNTHRLSAFRAHYDIDDTVQIVGGYQGKLGNRGERIVLQRPGIAPVDLPDLIPRLLEDEVVYDNLAPWPVGADGTGPSMQRINLTSYGNAAGSWVAAIPTPGAVSMIGDFNTDGLINEVDIDLLCGGIDRGDSSFDLTNNGIVDRQDLAVLVEGVLGTSFGDANLDGIFNSTDLVLVFQAAEYEDAIVGNSTWSEGDWNCDGEFNSADLVVAFQTAGFVAAATPPEADFAAAVRDSRRENVA